MEEQAMDLNRVSWQLLEKQEATAQRFSHELHDELGQTLAALRANLQALHPASSEERQRQADCLQLIDSGIDSVRELSQLLHPRVLDDFGLVGGLRWLCEFYAQRTEIPIDYQPGFSGHLPDETRTHLFRIAQEALTNIVRHAEANRVAIELSENSEWVTLSISDDGKGIDPEEAEKPPGMGLSGMRARARMAGGRLSIRSHPGKGTQIRVEVPVSRASNDSEKNTNSTRR
jgi:signal transduction histidine kinase